MSAKLNPGAQRTAVAPKDAEKRPEPAWRGADETLKSASSLQGALGNQAMLHRLGPGRPLDAGTRQRMEGVFRSDFSAVRVHTGEEAGVFSQRLQARAVTIGEDIAFAPGSYQPGTPVGDAILAHELAHVVQQRGSEPSERTSAPAVEPAGSPLEREAESSAVGAVVGLWAAARRGAEGFIRRVPPTLKSERKLQRCSNSVAAPPHVFKSCGFSPSVGGDLEIADDPGAPAPGRVDISSPTFRAEGEVTISGGTDAQARDWDVGFLQTVTEADRRAQYFNSAGSHHIYRKLSLPGPTRDGLSPYVVPWYGGYTVEPFPATNSTVKTMMDDVPSTSPPWKSPDGAGSLVAMGGKDAFCAWLAVRQRSTANILYLNWATWEVNWGAALDPVAKTGRGTGSGASLTGSGDGQGAVTPVLVNPVANRVLNDSITWAP